MFEAREDAETRERKQTFVRAAHRAIAVAFAGLSAAGIERANRYFPGGFVQMDARRTGRSGNDLRDGQSTRTYPANSTRAMERRKRQMAKALAKAGG